MTAEFTIDSASRLVAYTLSQLEPVEGFVELLDSILSHPDHRPGFSFQGDVRPDKDVPSTENVRRCVWEIRQRRDRIGPCRWAVVVPFKAVYGMMRMGSILLEGSGIEMGVFDLPEHAQTWLSFGGSVIEPQGSSND